MIHVFNCAKEVCALPGKACVECGKVCSQINCEPCKQCCDECGKVVSTFWDRPLSTYVALKVIMAAAQIYFCASALSDESLKSCNAEAKGGWVSGETWVQVQMGFAIVHLLFAPYFQSRVWRMVSEKLREGQFRLEPGFVVPQQIIFASFKEVFLYDLGILVYAMILCASFVWSMNGSSSMVGRFCDPGGNCGSASYLGLCFFWLAVVYNFCYYFCGCCASSVQLTDPDTELALYQPVSRRG
eukprot:s308_g42.t1